MISLVCIAAAAWLSSCNEPSPWSYEDDLIVDKYMECRDGLVVQNSYDENAEGHYVGSLLLDEKGENLKCQAGSCIPGEFQCNEAGYSLCESGGAFRVLKSCDVGLVCSQTAQRCVNTCVDDTFQCVDNSVMKCSNNSWNTVEECGPDALCNSTTGSCDSYCAGGEIRCDGNVLVTCDSNNNKTEKNCADDNQICDAEKKECVDQAAEITKCAPYSTYNIELENNASMCDGTKVVRCTISADATTAPEADASLDCAADNGKICMIDINLAASCVDAPDKCTKDETKCGDGADANLLFTCDEDGKWSASPINCAANTEGKTLCGLEGEGENAKYACIADSDICTKDETKCGEGETANVLYTCGEDGKWSTAVSTNCAEDTEGKTLCGLDGDDENAKYACIIDLDACTKDDTKCGEGETANVLYTCGADGKWSTAVSTNCAEDTEGKTLCGINTEAGEDNAFAECKAPVSCLDENNVSVEHGKSVCFNSDNYVGTKECSNGTWIDGDIHCNASEVCSSFDGKLGCFAPVNSVIGSSCECLNSGLCSWGLDSDDIKSLLLTKGNTHLEPLSSAINDDVDVVIPNFFPGISNITSSDESAVSTLSEQLEGTGLQVGCYRTSVINLSYITSSDKINNAISTIVDSYKMSIVRKMASEFANENGIENFNIDYADLTDLQKAEVDEYINKFILDSLGYSFADMLNMVNELADKLLTDIEFHSEKGYLVAGAVHIEANPNGEIGRRIFDSSSQNYSKLEEQVKKLEAGDFTAAEASKKCPEGSTYISYKFDEQYVNTLALIGDVDVNLAMCLKNCNSDYDCTEGNSCLDIPETISDGNDSETLVRVCFDKESIEYFKSLKSTIALESASE